MIEQIKQLRVEIDGLTQLCEGLKPIKDGGALHSILRDKGTIDIFLMSEEETRRKIEEYREECNRALDITSKNSQEIKEAVKSLKLSKAWLGKVLELLSPINSSDAEDTELETDKAEIICGSISEDPTQNRSNAREAFTVAGKLVAENYGTHIEKVTWLRTEIKEISRRGFKNIQELEHRKLDKLVWEAFKHLVEARFWLGFELGRVRDESK